MTNLLLIMSDQHAQRIAGCYGDASGVTPNDVPARRVNLPAI